MQIFPFVRVFFQSSMMLHLAFDKKVITVGTFALTSAEMNATIPVN